jgi:hypothetical protein
MYLIYISVNIVFALLLQWALDAYFCRCMNGEDELFAFDI